MLDNRQKYILKLLIHNSPQIFTSSDLALLTNVSTRTIKNDIAVINKFIEKYDLVIKSQPGKGNWIDSLIGIDSDLERYLNTSLDSDEILDYQIIQELIKERSYISVEEIADRFFLSSSSALRSIDKLTSELNKFGLKIIKKPRYGIKIIGEEQDKRLMLVRIQMLTQFGKEVEDLETENSLFDNVKSIILGFIDKFNLPTTSESIKNLITYVSISVERLLAGNDIEFPSGDIDEITKNIDMSYGRYLSDKIENQFNVTFDDSELAFLNINLLANNLVVMDNEESNSSNDIYLTYIYKWVNKLDYTFNTNFKENRSFMHFLTQHIKPMLIRMKYKIEVTNPWLDELKSYQKLAFEMAIFLVSEIMNDFQYPVTENEIAFLAIHIGAGLEKDKKQNSFDTIIITDVDSATISLLRSRLEYEFPNINITRMMTGEASLEFEFTNELIITTSRFNNVTSNTVLVSPILTEQDLKKINLKLTSKRYQLSDFIKQDIFFCSMEFSNKAEAINFMGNKLQEYNYVDNNFATSLMDREEYSTTAIGNLIAIPHALSGNVYEEAIGVIILKEPIWWDTNFVQLIFTIALNKKNSEILTNIYEQILSIGDKTEILKEIIQTKTYDEFLKIILEL
ncbi:BglG family transcription antiterminator [Suicoccus acidiformans]|nr:BglG family transcription antiterminator [Suicoccus acidiformans]